MYSIAWVLVRHYIVLCKARGWFRGEKLRVLRCVLGGGGVVVAL